MNILRNKLMKKWTLDDYIKLIFDCLSTERSECKDKYVNPDNMEEEEFNDCYDFVNQHKWYFFNLFAKHLVKKYFSEDFE